jgi:type II secretory pathway predicted ATPase ExeA
MAGLFENPFRTAPGSDPPAFVGRDQELAIARFAAGMTRSGAPTAPVIITGLRGMGKTALLRRAMADARADKAIVVYAEATRREPFGAVLRAGLESAQESIGSLPDKLKRTIEKVIRVLPKAEYELPDGAGAIALSGASEPDQKPFMTVLRELSTQAWKHGRYLVFAIDEIQEAQINDLSPLVRFIHETAGTAQPALIVGAGLPNSRDHLYKAHTYTERWRYLDIGLLTSDQTREAIAKPIRDAGQAISHHGLDALVAESAGYPFFIQEYASAAWMQHQGKTITSEDVAAVLPGVRRILETSLYDSRFRALTPRECAYVLVLADLGPGPRTVHEIADRLGSDSERVSSIRNQLVKKDVLFVPSGGMVEFRIPLSDRYVQAHRTELERRAAAKPSVSIDRGREPSPSEAGKSRKHRA